MFPNNFPEYLNAAVTFIVGLIAFAIYWLQKLHERQNAATIVLADIRHAEQVVLTILERRQIDVWMKDVLKENNWSRYKHLFARVFSSDDLSAFNRFFDSCTEMSDARRRMRELHYAALDEKCRIMQQQLSTLDELPAMELDEKVNNIVNRINRNLPLFTPDEPKERLFLNLQQMGRLSNTTGFEKLKKLAKDI
ncbi:MAG: hypothetical protein V4724_01925 [Pseudomonadota bacterium]